MSKTLTLLLLALLGALTGSAVPGCITDPTTGETVVDWPTFAAELGLAADDLRDVAGLVSDDALSTDLVTLADYLDAAAKAIGDEAAATPDALDLIDKALALAGAAVDALPEDDQGDARAALVVARSVLRRVRAYA